MFNNDETVTQDHTPNVPPTESEMNAMCNAYHRPPTYQLGPENFTLCVLMEDAILHDDEHPFCFDLTCPCHQDQDLLREYADKPIERGHLTQREARRLWLSEVL